ncbi:rubrerythrin family protein [Arcticibacter eurypsychrophilus]|uniref:rubrerythrin family protein n=1 Tax=Arcticibacter eurypsychrophilus TaxID=1434752 RepID=UPI001480B90F|nr:rubrerythrin family protein [Arcticibacter eurypsychrophilus]
MKKLLIITVLISLSGMILTSCGNSGKNTAMKSPEQNESKSEENEGKENEGNESLVKQGTDVKAKTTENMLAAFKGETTASAKYAAYSKKAEQEGYHQIALLFKAASTSENIHANNHKAVLQESGTVLPTIKPEFTIKSTKENLEDAIKGETYEVTTMYPDFITTANTANNQMALISLNYAYKTEKKHKVMYTTALIALNNKTDKNLPSVFYICSTCGNTYETTAPARCGISMTSSDKFLKLTSV